jgi:DNA-binding MurR/RpiR family transcriptional regulator
MTANPRPNGWAGRYAGMPVLARVAARAPTLPAALQRTAQAVLAQPFRAATHSIDEFARAAAVSVASANRFARAMGYDGYPQFRSELAKGFESVLAPVASLRDSLQQPASATQAVAASLQEVQRNLEQTLRALPHQPCTEAVNLIVKAQQVLTLGWGSSAYLAGLLQHELEPYCSHIDSLGQVGGPSHAARQLVKRGPRDLVIALAFPRYVEDTVTLARLARERGVKVLALTDGPASPLVSLADVALYVNVDRQVAACSNAAALALLEALVAAVARRADNAVARAEALTRGVMPWLHRPGA